MTTGVTDPPPTTPEVLIPEARRHQRGRYVRLGIMLAVAALLIVVLIASAVVLSGRSAGGKTNPRASATALSGSVGHVYFRPVLCFAPPYVAADHTSSISGSPTCSAASLISLKNLAVVPEGGGSPSGFTTANVPPDESLAGVPSTKPSADNPARTVLLAGIRGACDGGNGIRCVLGPAAMSSRLIEKATVTRTQYGAWVVDFTFTPRGSVLWDKVTNESFHLMLGIELNGVVYSAPIIQPTQSSFSSFNGKGEISGSLTRAEARRLATAMKPPSG